MKNLASRLSSETGLLTVIVVILVFMIGALAGMQIAPAGPPALFGAAGSQACDMSPLAVNTPVALVFADPLNLRDGPGMTYNVLATLEMCQPLALMGRTSDSQWVQVLMPDSSLKGWVSASYLQANVWIHSLEITGARRGPAAPETTGGQKGVYVVISEGQAAAFAKGLPANQSVSAVLSPANAAGKGVQVGYGKTDDAGMAIFAFDMPRNWSDGSVVTQGNLLIVVTTSDGSSVSAALTYYSQ
ncbi:MAG: SH3 domain-containing protein [Chloroflexota bacterium]